MSEHKATIVWARNGADFGYKTYPRDHAWRFDNGIEIPGSAAPAYLGNPDRVDPEGAFVAALASCHMLTFLALASNRGFVVDSYEDCAVGHLGKNANGKMAVIRIDLRPQITFSGAGCTAARPGPPTNLKATPGDGHVVLTWDRPANGAGGQAEEGRCLSPST